MYIALAPNAVELQHEGEGRIVLLVRKRETRVHQAQIEAGLRGLSDRIWGLLQHRTTLALGAVNGKSKDAARRRRGAAGVRHLAAARREA
ncbi:MAG: hypothetical protein FJ399_06465 [Verrucomicrobia bacterium]|nr:hypothetical protein [Verrucomicrobiota bacterium]